MNELTSELKVNAKVLFWKVNDSKSNKENTLNTIYNQLINCEKFEVIDFFRMTFCNDQILFHNDTIIAKKAKRLSFTHTNFGKIKRADLYNFLERNIILGDDCYASNNKVFKSIYPLNLKLYNAYTLGRYHCSYQDFYQYFLHYKSLKNF